MRAGEDRYVKVVGASRGDPYGELTASGKAKALFDAMERRFPRLQRVDVNRHGLQKGLVAAAAWSPSSERWMERRSKHPVTFWIQSRNARRRVAAVGGADVVVQINGLFRTVGAPYVVYTDTTFTQVRETWPESLPFGAVTTRAILENERRLFREAQHVFPMGRETADAIVAVHGIHPDRVTAVGAGANLVADDARDGRAFAPTILFVGREYRRKGGDVLVAAFRAVRAAIPSARLLVVGSRPDVAEEGVEVIGPVDDRRVLSALYREAEVFCLPSLAEPYGLVLLEAMGHALPCVGTTVGAMPEIIVDGETGLLVPPGEPAPLAAALIELLRDRDRARSMGRAARARVERQLSWEAVVDRMTPALLAAAGR